MYHKEDNIIEYIVMTIYCIALSLERKWRIDKNFPVVYELWNSILRFPLILTQMIEEKIKVPDLSVMVRIDVISLESNA